MTTNLCIFSNDKSMSRSIFYAFFIHLWLVILIDFLDVFDINFPSDFGYFVLRQCSLSCQKGATFWVLSRRDNTLIDLCCLYHGDTKTQNILFYIYFYIATTMFTLLLTNLSNEGTCKLFSEHMTLK